MRLVFGMKRRGSALAATRFVARSRLLLLGLVAVAALLVPAAQAAAANFPLTVTAEGDGSGTIECEVESGPAEACEAEYAEGTEIAFVAEPATGSEFVEWGEDCIGQGDECELTIEEATAVSAVFEPEEVPLEVSTEGEGLGEVECEVESGPAEECEAEYPFGTEIAFVAEPEEGSEFVEWEEDCTGSGACELTMDEARSVTAIFDLAHFALEIETEGNGEGTIECEVEGGPAEPCESTYLEGTEVALVAEPETGSEFVEWEEDCTGSGACELTMDEAHSVTANFALIEFTLEVEVEGPGSVSAPEDINCPGVCGGVYLQGKTVTLVAAPNGGAEFVEWTGCDNEPSATKCEVTMDEDRSVGALFAFEPGSEFSLTVTPAGSGSGTVTSSPAGISCPVDCSEAYGAGKEITLTATAASGSTFSGWSGACTGAGACKVTMSQARSVTATFAKEATPPPPGTVSVGPTAKIKSGKALLKLTCKGAGPCKGSLKLTAKIKQGKKTKNLTIGKGSFNLAAGAQATLKVKLSAPAKQAVAKKPLKAKVSGSGVSGSTVKLKK